MYWIMSGYKCVIVLRIPIINEIMTVLMFLVFKCCKMCQGSLFVIHQHAGTQCLVSG